MLEFSALSLETFIPNSFNLTYDCFVGPCQGFKHLGIIHNYDFSENSTVILYSDNNAQIEWTKTLLSEWTGNLYQLWGLVKEYKRHSGAILKFPPIMENQQINSVYLDQFYSEYGIDMDLLMEQWHRIKKFKWIFISNIENVVDEINKVSTTGVYIYDNQNQIKLDRLIVPAVVEITETVKLVQ